MSYSHIADNLHMVRERIGTYAQRNARKFEDITLVLVTKNHAAEVVKEIYSQGQSFFAESRVQESEKKYVTTAHLLEKRTRIRLDMIGGLQRNKVRKAIRLFDCIQSVDSVKLIQEIEKEYSLVREERDTLDLEGSESKRQFPIFLQVRCSDHDDKRGFASYDDLRRAYDLIKEKNILAIQGLMTIAPFSREERVVRVAFKEARIWKEQLEQEYDISELALSMGMSNDLEWAIAEGSTMVRVGSAILGARS